MEICCPVENGNPMCVYSVIGTVQSAHFITVQFCGDLFESVLEGGLKLE
jgi:hypothetical protein